MAVHCLQLQLYEKPSDKYCILKQMTRSCSLSTLQAAWDALIMVKKSYTHALEGDIDTSPKQREGVYFVLHTMEPSLITYDIYYNCVLDGLAALEHTPLEDTKTRLLFHANTALLLLAEEDEEIREHWQGMLLPAMCRLLLGIGVNFSRTDYDVTHQDRAQAKTLLSLLNQFSCGKGARREMMYNFLMAVILAEENSLDARAYARRACVLSKEGAYREVEQQNIITLKNFLENVFEGSP